MPKTKQQKQEILTEMSARIKQAKSVVLADYTGLKVSETQELRKKCKAQSVEIMALKKTLLRKVLAEQGLGEVADQDIEGSITVAVSQGDEVAPAKILNDFAKTHAPLKLRFGFLEGKAIPLTQIKFLANLPSKLELLAKAVGSMQAPISGFVRVLQGNLSGLVRVLAAIKK